MPDGDKELEFKTTDDNGKTTTTTVSKDEDGVISLTIEASVEKDGDDKVIENNTLSITPAGSKQMMAGIHMANKDGVRGLGDGCTKMAVLTQDDAFVQKVKAAFEKVAKDDVLDAQEAGDIGKLLDEGIQKLQLPCVTKGEKATGR